MNEQILLPRQRSAFLLTAVSAPAVAAAGRLSWVWVLAVTLLAASVAVCLHVLQARSSASLPEHTRGVWGPWLPLLQAAFAAVLLWHFALGSDAAFPDDNTVPFVPLTLLAAAVWAAYHGEAACVRAVSVLFFFVAGLYIIVFAFSVKQMQWHRLTEPAPPGDLLPLGVVLLLPLLGQYLQPPRETGKPFPAVFLAAFVALPALASAVCTAVPGSRGSFYTMAKSVEVLSFAQRIEPLVSVVQTVGWFSALCLTILTAARLLAAAGVPQKWSVLPPALAAVPGIVLQIRIPAGILLLLGAVFCIIFPLLTQAIVAQKKFQKR